jgi:hypothetical protein
MRAFSAAGFRDRLVGVMIRALKGIGAVAMMAMLAGCGAQGEAYQPRTVPASKSVIYIYRPFKVLGSTAVPMITCGPETIELDSGGYYDFVADSGQVICTAAGDTASQLKFDADPGGQYYVREDVVSGTLGSHTSFKLMNAAVGGDEIKDCKRQGIKQ